MLSQCTRFIRVIVFAIVIANMHNRVYQCSKHACIVSSDACCVGLNASSVSVLSFITFLPLLALNMTCFQNTVP